MSVSTLGLTLGKFAPLRRGHQLVIDAALAEVEHLVALVYDCPDVTRTPLATRARWIRELYPAVEVIEARGGPVEVGDAPEITRAHDAYILELLAGRRVTHFYSSEFYGRHVSAALSAIDRRVDPERRAVAVSGAAVRNDPYRFRGMLAPRVYRDLITHAVFLGAPSTGKSTVCEHAAERCHTVWTPEYGREYWETHQVDRRLTSGQLAELAQGHIEREERQLLAANRVLFTDTNALTTLLFARHYHGSALPLLEKLADQVKDRYDVTFLCGDDIPYDDTWDRSGDAQRAEMQQWTVEELERRGIAYTLLTGPIEARIETVLREL